MHTKEKSRPIGFEIISIVFLVWYAVLVKFYIPKQTNKETLGLDFVDHVIVCSRLKKSINIRFTTPDKPAQIFPTKRIRRRFRIIALAEFPVFLCHPEFVSKQTVTKIQTTHYGNNARFKIKKRGIDGFSMKC
ncbi:unnamed protein product [Rhizophagus irregularis]|nr:unnamed protein product [Rhizophagus irregularis]CAB5350836.1 unnamed protein product [Rhizophagus irregularis]